MITFFINLNFVYAQDFEIGKEYLKNNEFTKAKSVFEKLAKNKDQVNDVHKYYLQVLYELKELDAAEKFLKKQIKKSDGNAKYLVDFGNLKTKQEKPHEAKVNFEKAILKVVGNEYEATELSNYFYEIQQPDYAIATLLGSRQFMNKPSAYAATLGRFYKANGRIPEMINEYITLAESEGNLDQFKTIIQEQLKGDKEIKILEKVLYEKVQKYPDSAFYTEALISYLITQKLFFKAFLQAKALDKRMKYDGNNVYELALLTRQNKDFANAAKMFEYLVKEYPNNLETPVVRRFLIGCKEEVIKGKYPIDKQEIKNLISEYDKLLAESGVNLRTLEALKNKANLYAFYLDDRPMAKEILEKAIKEGQQDKNFVSRCKLDLGDIQLLENEFWDATLTYQQVEKLEKDNPTGYDAKLRNAKLNYYKGDFELAEDILGILKKATTREIANDAMELNLLIKDNIGADSTESAMKCYAAAELLIFQNKISQAIDSLSSIPVRFKQNTLNDEAIYKRANCYFKIGELEKGVEDLEKIVKDFSEDVLGDDATYLLATTYEENLKQPQKAMDLYQLILKKYPGSMYVVDARNRFRNLRGDTIN